MSIIRLAAAHAAPYRELMLHGYEHAPDAFTTTPEERADAPLSWWVKRIADPQGLGLAFGAFADEQLVGTVALEFFSKPKARHKVHVVGMYVLPSSRGQGLGRQLLAAALTYTEQRPDLAVATLTVTEGNDPAIRLYEAAGFRVFGTEPLAIRTPAGYKAKVHMWRELAAPTSAS